MSAYFTSKKTNVCALLVMLCGSIEAFDVFGPKYGRILLGLCAVVTGIGFFVSKDANVSNAPDPKAAAVVSPVDQAKPNPAVEV